MRGRVERLRGRLRWEEVYLRGAQTTWNDLGEWSLAGGFTPRPGLVALRRARSKPSSSRQIPFAGSILSELTHVADMEG